MTGSLLQKCLLVVYVIIMAVYVSERNYPKALYWFGALVITYSVLIME